MVTKSGTSKRTLHRTRDTTSQAMGLAVMVRVCMHAVSLSCGAHTERHLLAAALPCKARPRFLPQPASIVTRFYVLVLQRRAADRALCCCVADGYYWITGRVDDVINVSGHRIGTAEVESALVLNEKCAEAAVVGFEHPIKGQGIYAFVTLMDGVEFNADAQKELVMCERLFLEVRMSFRVLANIWKVLLDLLGVDRTFAGVTGVLPLFTAIKCRCSAASPVAEWQPER